MNDKTLQDRYLRRILNSKVYDVAIESPLEKASTLSKKLGNTFLLKREDLQSVHSFKLRGAYNKMSQLPRAALEKGVLAASAGNHAQGVALSAKRLGCKATIVMPVTTPEIKIASVKSFGASIVLAGPTFDDFTLAQTRSGAAFPPASRWPLRFLHPDGSSAPTCHSIQAFQDGRLIGDAHSNSATTPQEMK
jgi:threonine dehydratase